MPAPLSRTRGFGRTLPGEAALIAAGLVAVAGLHLWAARYGDPIQLHLAFTRLYYVPILYAAWVFGVRGGALAALATSVVFALQAHMFHGGLFEASGSHLIEVASFFVVGGLFGWLLDLHAARRAESLEVEVSGGSAYRKLEARAMEIMIVRNYIDTVVRSLSSGVLTVGPDGSVTTANPAAERMLGVTEGQMVPRPMASLLSDDAGLDKDLAKVLGGRLPRLAREAEVRTFDGRALHVRTSVSRMVDGSGRILGAVVTINDMTEVHALTERLIRADRLAALGQLTAGVAHEIRNPLTAVRTWAQILEEGRCNPDTIAKATAVIREETDRVERVIDTLLRFGRPPEPVVGRLDVRDVLRDVALFTRRFADRGGVTIVEEYPGDLPDVLADADQLKQVFVNLVTNAVQVMDDGGTVRLTAAAADGFVRVRVADDGPGIPSEELSRVFDPFFTRREDGTGLGLSIVHRIVEEHRGHIEVTSRPGEGTVFTVVLPVAPPQGAERTVPAGEDAGEGEGS
ncbi:MAG: PAS domain-containing protein [Actinobacteria bacterium]|nr:MAG: PAS domain-containing protein [Actinomycetota bacterium]